MARLCGPPVPGLRGFPIAFDDGEARLHQDFLVIGQGKPIRSVGVPASSQVDQAASGGVDVSAGKLSGNFVGR